MRIIFCNVKGFAPFRKLKYIRNLGIEQIGLERKKMELSKVLIFADGKIKLTNLDPL